MKILGVRLFEPRYVIGEGDGRTPLLIRWVLFRVPAFGIFLHKLCRSDYDRALHNHPWSFISIVLKGGYFEVHDHTVDREQKKFWRGPGEVMLRPAEWRHRVEIGRDPYTRQTKPAWTLVFVGRRVQRWGFFLPDGWCWWRKHDNASNICSEDILHTNGKY